MKNRGIPDYPIWAALSEASQRINHATNEITRSIGAIDRALAGLNIGLAVWKYLEPGDSAYERIGYARLHTTASKLHSQWGICLGAGDREWYFADAPRMLRLAAIDHIPDLLDAIREAADKTADVLCEKINTVSGVAK